MRGLTACMQCGSLELRPLKVSDGGGIPGLQFEMSHCRICDWQGIALEFDDEASWRAFVKAQGGSAETNRTPSAERIPGPHNS